MKDVYWLEQTEADVPVHNDWLAPAEALRLAGLSVPKRRADWRLGRWTAKRAVAACLELPGDHKALAEIEIRPAPSGAPLVSIANRSAQVGISLSHGSGMAVCAVAFSPVALGCDIEKIEPRSQAFAADYFTSEEQTLVAQSPLADRDRLLTLLWCGKESALKALQSGLRLDTRAVVVSPEQLPVGPGGWRPLQVRCEDGKVFHGLWQQTAGFIETLISAPPPNEPIRLESRLR